MIATAPSDYQHWFRLWLGAVRQQAIYLSEPMLNQIDVVALGHSELEYSKLECNVNFPDVKC